MATRIKRFRMTRIEPPTWATQPDLRIYNTTVADYAAIQRHRDKMLRVVHKEVEAYMNDPRLVFDDETGFPNRQRMTGDYYIGGESYEVFDESVVVIAIRCRCIEFPKAGVNREDDYLGLEVWLRCFRKRWATFEVCRNTDSSSI